jgi:hypothetical protein
MKLATHEHLKDSAAAIENFKNSAARHEAVEAVQTAARAMSEKNASVFVSASMKFADILRARRLVLPETIALMSRMRAEMGEKCILSSKGCGALGADVICVLHTPENKSLIQKFCAENQLLYLASSQESDDTGLKIEELKDRCE